MSWRRFWRGELVDFVALDGQILTVRGPQPLTGEESLKLQVRQGERVVGLRWLPSTSREVPGGFVSTGLVMRHLSRLTPGSQPIGPEDYGFLRGSERIPFRALVRSRELPGFQAMTVDLSDQGVQLDARGSVLPETWLQFKLDLSGVQAEVPLTGRVAWCEGHRLGMQCSGARWRDCHGVYWQLRRERETTASELLARAQRQWRGSSAPWPED